MNDNPALFADRCVVSVGISSCTVPVYVSECSPSDRRGMLVTIVNLCITGGQFTASVVDGLFCHTDNGWR